jgi:divalent metal cation (Fe/Co/Zn/Cd) transporter
MKKLLKYALILSLITIIYNIAEGVISVFFGLEDETLALFGFGVDSFVEVISGIGILHMVIRMKNSRVETRDHFEKTALKITGFSFYLLTAGLVFGSVVNTIGGNKPHTTLIGIIVAIVSILTMYFLMRAKLKVGRACFYLSFLLLISSVLYEIFQIGYVDIIGSLGIAYFSLKEGREAFEKVKSGNLSCCDDSSCNTNKS